MEISKVKESDNSLSSNNDATRDSINEANVILNSKFINLPEYTNGNESKLGTPISYFDDEEIIAITVSSLVGCGMLTSMLFLSISSPLGAIISFSTASLFVTGFLTGALAKKYNGGGKFVKDQPFLRLMSRLSLTKKNKKLLAQRVKERETYLLAMEAKEMLANKMIEEMNTNGDVDALLESMNARDKHLKVHYRLEFDRNSQTIKTVSHNKPSEELSYIENTRVLGDIIGDLSDLNHKPPAITP